MLLTLAMSEQTRQMLPWLAGAAPLAAVAVGVLGWRGQLSGRAITEAPPRKVQFGLMEFGIAIIVYYVAAVTAGLAATALGLVHDRDVPPHDWPTMKLAMYMVFTSLMSGVFFIAYAIALPLSQGDDPRHLGLLPDVRKWPRHVLIVFVALLALMPVYLTVNISTVLTGESLGFGVPDAGHKTLKVITEANDPPAVALLIFSAVVLAPLFEELLFRGIIQTCFLNMMNQTFGPRTVVNAEGQPVVREADISAGVLRWIAIVVTAGLFAVVHIGSAPWQSLPSLFVVGVTFGYVYERTGNLWPSIVLHALFNVTNVALALWLFREAVV